MNLPQPDGRDGCRIELAALHLGDHGRLVSLLAVPEEAEVEGVFLAFRSLLAVGELGALTDGALPRLEDLSPRALGGSQGADLDGFRLLFLGRRGRRKGQEGQGEARGDSSKHGKDPFLWSLGRTRQLDVFFNPSEGA